MAAHTDNPEYQPLLDSLFREQQANHREQVDQLAAKTSFACGILFVGLGIVVGVIQGLLVRRLTKRLGEATMAIAGPALIAVGLFVLGLPFGVPKTIWIGLSVGCFILAVGHSLFNPAVQSLISRHAASYEQGEIMGANQGMASLARALGPLLAGFLFQRLGPPVPYFVAATICLTVAAVALALRKQLRPPAAL